MYQMALTVIELPGCWAVRASLTARQDDGRVVHIADATERLIALESPSEDPLTDIYRVLVQWARAGE